MFSLIATYLTRTFALITNSKTNRLFLLTNYLVKAYSLIKKQLVSNFSFILVSLFLEQQHELLLVNGIQLQWTIEERWYT